MANFCYFSIMLLVTFGVCSASPVAKSSKMSEIVERAEQLGMQLLGVYDNKTFFQSKLSHGTVNWLEARTECLMAGLQMATYRSRDEYYFVKNNIVEDGSCGFWVGYEIEGQFNFKGNSFVAQDGSRISDVNINFNFLSEHWLCPFLNARQDAHHTAFCISTRQHYLCQHVEE